MGLENLISDVLKWQSTLEDLGKEKDTLLMENKSLKSAIENISASEQIALKEVGVLKESLRILQESFLRRYDYKEECERLKLEIKDNEERKIEERSLMEQQIKQLRQDMDAQKRKHAESLSEMCEDRQMTVKATEIRLNQQVVEWQEKANAERAQREEQRREKDAEIANMRMEFDSKMKRMQDLHMKLQNKASSSTTGNDVFRKKLQHEREISSQKIRKLEEEIISLKSKLTSRQENSNAFISGYSRHIANTVTPTFNKKRKIN